MRRGLVGAQHCCARCEIATVCHVHDRAREPANVPHSQMATRSQASAPGLPAGQAGTACCAPTRAKARLVFTRGWM